MKNSHLFLIIFCCSIVCCCTSKNKDRELLILKEENKAIKAELDSLKGMLNKINFSSWIVQRNFGVRHLENDTILLSASIINKHLSIDSNATINLFKVNGNDTLPMSELNHVVRRSYLEGVLFLSIAHLKKGNYFIEIKNHHVYDDLPFHYEWEIE